jgi:hypothetical protein
MIEPRRLPAILLPLAIGLLPVLPVREPARAVEALEAQFARVKAERTRGRLTPRGLP